MLQRLETLSLDLLKTFMVFVQTGGVEEAARQLGLTQAAVSLQLKKLQEEAGVDLFQNIGRKKILTEFAKDLFQTLAPPFYEIERRLKEVSLYKLSPEQKNIRLGCAAFLMRKSLQILNLPNQNATNQETAISRLNGKVQFKQISENGFAQLRDDKIDLLITDQPPAESSQWVVLPLFQSKFKWIGSQKAFKKNHMHLRELISMSESLQKNPIVASEQNDFLIKTFLGQSTTQYFEANYYCDDWKSVVDVVAEVDGWSIVPQEVNVNEQEISTVVLPAEICEPVDYFVVYSASLKESPWVQGLIRKN